MAKLILVRIQTRREAQRRIFALVGSLAALQILLDSMYPFLGRVWMLGIRILGASVAATGAILFEMHKVRRPPL